MVNTIVERGRCFDAVFNDSLWESPSDPFFMRSSIVATDEIGRRLPLARQA